MLQAYRTKITIDGVQYVLYGEPMVTSLYAVAKSLVDTGVVTEGSDEYNEIKGIMDEATNEGFGNDAGADTGDFWK